jgi:ATP-dependent DNA helicase RecG
MHQLGLKEPSLIERDNDVLVTIRHEPLASPEEAIMRYLDTHETIGNKTARAIAHVGMDYQMKSIFGKMKDKGLIEQVPGTRRRTTAYRKVKRDETS